MSIPIPLAVEVSTSRGTRHITRDLADLSFRTTAPGGFASARFSLHRPLGLDPDEIAHFGRVRVTDARNGLVVWEGRLEDPGRAAGDNGEIYSVGAQGPSAHTRDRTTPLIYVDSRISALVVATTSGRSYSVGTRESANAVDGALSISAGQGNVVTTLSLGAAVYDPVYAAGQDLARVSVDWDTGFTSANSQVQLRTAEDLGVDSLIEQDDVNTAGGNLTGSLGGANAIPANHNRFILTLRRSGPTATVADDLHYAEFFNLAVIGSRVLKDGTAKTSSYSTNTVLANEVVEDLLGRLLPQFDGAGASVAVTSFAIGQLAYPDGVTAERVLADLMELEAGHLWEALEANAAGKYRFSWRPWPTVARYECDLVDGYESVQSAGDLYDAVTVRYRNSIGQIRTVRRTQTVAVLTAAGVPREAFVDLGDEVSTQANAERIGDQFLADHGFTPNAGRLTVARPVLDIDAGRMVMPWEIRPGYLLRVRGLSPRTDSLNGTRDGMTTFRVVAVDYSAADAAAQLELDTPPPSVARRIADLIVRPATRRR